MSQTLYRYRVYCTSFSHYTYAWGTQEPTVCPDHGGTLDTNLTTIVEVIDKNLVFATEPNYGDFETTHVKMDISSGTPGDITEHDVTWDMDILLWRTYLTPGSDMIGDEITVVAAPETTVGALTATVNINDTVLNVDSGIFNYISRGYLITLDDGVNKDVLGRITAIDSGAGTITVKTPASYSFAAATPVKMSIYVLKDIYINDTVKIDIGGKGMKGKKVPAGTILRVYYKNNTGTSKTFRWRPEYYNQG